MPGLQGKRLAAGKEPMTRFVDGPAHAAALLLQRRPMPFQLRVTMRPGPDALDQPADEAAPNETLFAYELLRHDGWCHMNFGGGRGGFYAMASYRFIPDQPDDATMRDNDAWAKWATERGTRILGTLAMFDNLDEPRADE
jgi:hypothetical protein